MAVLMLWPILLVLHITACYASDNARNDLLMAMYERLESVERKLVTTHAYVESLEKKLELYNRKNDELVQENVALRQLVHGIEVKNSKITDRMSTLASIVYDIQKDYQKCQKTVHKLKKEKFTSFVPSLISDEAVPENANHAYGHKMKHTNRGNTIQKRIVPPTSEPADQIAFYTYLSANTEANLRQHHTLVFDVVITNRGHGYHQGDGIFTVPSSGLYVFVWTITVQSHGFASVEILVNAEVLGSAFGGATTAWNEGTGTIVVAVNTGDHVFLRMQENGVGPINSNARGRTSFSGWKLQ